MLNFFQLISTDSLNSKAIYCKDDGYTSKRREWGGIDEPLRKGKMTGNNRAWELLLAAGCGPFPQDIGGPVPCARVNWARFGRGASCASQLRARKSGPAAQEWPPGAHPWCEGIFPETGDRRESGGLCSLRPLQPQWRALCYRPGTRERQRRPQRKMWNLCRPALAHHLLLHSSVIPWCLSGDRGVLQRCGWWVTIVAPVESGIAQSTQGAADWNHAELMYVEFARGIWSCENTAGSGSIS